MLNVVNVSPRTRVSGVISWDLLIYEGWHMNFISAEVSEIDKEKTAALFKPNQNEVTSSTTRKRTSVSLTSYLLVLCLPVFS
ncbi:hypothetical protein J6590_061623 [Homalodisca vitripennis]|nr:hypothetical protein J6590_061623 [Homalodisca vitripennis]